MKHTTGCTTRRLNSSSQYNLSKRGGGRTRAKRGNHPQPQLPPPRRGREPPGTTTHEGTLLLSLTTAMCDPRSATQFIFPLASLPSAHSDKKGSVSWGRWIPMVFPSLSGSCFRPVKCDGNTQIWSCDGGRFGRN